MTTAMVGAGVAALVTGAVMPDTPQPDTLALVDSSTAADVAARAQANADRASRDNDRTVATSTEMQAPDIWVLPMQNYVLTSKFGERWGRLHPGNDLGAAHGAPYKAIARGKVILARWNGGYGNNIMIDHGDGIVSVYGHSTKLLVKEGDLVEAGQVIGLVGNTGYSFGDHLHLEIRVNGKPTDPIPFLRSKGVDIVDKTDALTA